MFEVTGKSIISSPTLPPASSFPLSSGGRAAAAASPLNFQFLAIRGPDSSLLTPLSPLLSPFNFVSHVRRERGGKRDL